MKVYGDARSGNCYKIQLVCGLLDIPYDWVAVDVMSGETRKPPFLAKNPNGRVPLLELDDGHLLAESNAIINYLAAGSALLPTDTFELALLQQWQFFEQYSHEPHIAVARFIKAFQGMPAARQAEYESKIPGGYAALGVMEQHLSSVPWFVGNGPTTADISLYAYTHVAHEGGFDLAQYPVVRAWLKRVEALPRYVPMESGVSN